MLVPFVIVAVIAAGLLVLLVLARQRTAHLQGDLTDTTKRLEATEGELATVGEQRREAEERATELAGRVDDLEGTVDGLEGTVGELNTKADQLTRRGAELDVRVAELTTSLGNTSDQLTAAEETLRKRTELADAQATQIDAISAARDELQLQLTAAEEQIVTLSARPGMVVGESGGDPAAATLWDLEVARSERSWRNSVAINPADDTSPFADADDPVRTAVEIEASALREDVGALIAVDWKAQPIESAARRVLVVRVAQEMLASASRVPGAARLVATDDASGSVTLAFEAADDGATLNLISPPVSTDMIAVNRDNGLSVTVRADDTGEPAGDEVAAADQPATLDEPAATD
ncbi:MAG: hypothetical protein AAGA93_03170 [Actinomycetota bacterium]